MKTYIEKCNISGKVSETVAHMFCTGGNGVELNNKGYLVENHQCDEMFIFPEPESFKYIYPWSDIERYQPFRKLAGCRDVGFKETVEYFLKCLEITPDTVDGIKEWKGNIKIMKDVLLNTPTITDEYGDIEKGFESFKDKVRNSYKSIDKIQDRTKVTAGNSVSKVWFFDVQWSDCPSFVEDEVRGLWKDYELGNDNYIHTTKLDEELFEEYPNIYYWLKFKGVNDDEKVIVHWWW